MPVKPELDLGIGGPEAAAEADGPVREHDAGFKLWAAAERRLSLSPAPETAAGERGKAGTQSGDAGPGPWHPGHAGRRHLP